MIFGHPGKSCPKKKKELENGVRLENASWRTWAKQKYNLKTVNPEKLNWLKDSDVTWLYGPLHTSAWSMEISPKSIPYTEDKLNLMPTTKSCLKKRSISDILRPIARGRYGGSLVISNSDTQLYLKGRDNDMDSSDCETASTCSSLSDPMTPTTLESFPFIGKNRKIQFNDRVEQCIAVDSDDGGYGSDSENGSDDGIEMNISRKRKDGPTICKLAPTKLKEDRIHHNGHRARGPSSKSPSSTTSQLWDDDDELDSIDLIDFEPPTISSPFSGYQAEGIIHSENQHHFQDNSDDGVVEKVIHLINWAFSIN